MEGYLSKYLVSSGPKPITSSSSYSKLVYLATWFETILSSHITHLILMP